MFILGLTVFTACKFEEPVVFRIIDDVQIESIRDGMANLSARAVFYNPNNARGKLKKVDIVVELEGKTLAHIHQDEHQPIGSNAEFSIPIKIRFAMADAQQGLLSNLMNILTGNKIELHFIGDIKVSTFGFSQTVKVDYYEEVKLQL